MRSFWLFRHLSFPAVAPELRGKRRDECLWTAVNSVFSPLLTPVEVTMQSTGSRTLLGPVQRSAFNKKWLFCFVLRDHSVSFGWTISKTDLLHWTASYKGVSPWNWSESFSLSLSLSDCVKHFTQVTFRCPACSIVLMSEIVFSYSSSSLPSHA